MMRRTILAALTLLLSVSLAAGLGRADAAPLVHPGDTLGIDVLNYAAVIDNGAERLKALQAGSVVVASDGSISMPVVGSLHVAGKSTGQIKSLIEARLAAYIRDPSVNVRLLQQSQTIFLTGATIGTLPYLPGETLSSALGQLRQQFEKDDGPALAAIDKNGGTLTRSALDLRRITLQRDGRPGQLVNGEDIIRSGQPGPALDPNDTLIFASKPIRVDVRGAVAAPGPIYLYPEDTLEQALQQAGGPLETASSKENSLIRGGQDQPLTLGGAAMRQAPQNGDAIVVRVAPKVTVLGQVPTPGEFTLKNGSTLLGALYVSGGPTKWANVKDIQVVHNGDRKSYNLTGLQHGDLSSNIPLSDGDIVYVPEGHKIDISSFLQSITSVVGGALK